MTRGSNGGDAKGGGEIPGSHPCWEKMSRHQKRQCHSIEKCHAIKSVMSRNQSGNVTQSIRKMSQCWMKFLAAHEDGEVKVNQEHFIRIPFYQSMSQWYHVRKVGSTVNKPDV